MAIQLDIVTPERKAFSDEVNNVYLPGADGEIGVLSLHEALVTTLAAGELRYEKDGKVIEMAIGGGFAEITQQSVTVLTDAAATADELDNEVVQKAVERARKHLEGIDRSKDPELFKEAEQVLLKHEARMQLFQKVRKG